MEHIHLPFGNLLHNYLKYPVYSWLLLIFCREIENKEGAQGATLHQ